MVSARGSNNYNNSRIIYKVHAMKEILKRMIRHCIAACGRCFSTGYIELPNGDTVECHICKGKGVI